MSGGRWDAKVAGLACAIEKQPTGDWVVTIASTTISRRSSLAAAIVDAGGGYVTEAEAKAVASLVKAHPSTRPSDAAEWAGTIAAGPRD